MEDADVTRRRIIGLLGAAVLAACSSAAKRASPPSGSPATTAASRASATTRTSSAPATTTGASTTAPTSVVPGSNKNITAQVLAQDAKGYNGTWSGTWMVPTFGTTGTISGVASIDPTARTLAVRIVVTGDLLHDGVPIAPFTVDGSVDSYTYADDGTFAIHKATPVGDATIMSVTGIGSGQFHLKVVNIPSHPSVASFEATGVANRAGVIPTTMKVTYTDGTTASGTCQFTHAPG
jgi:hypothetical protein